MEPSLRAAGDAVRSASELTDDATIHEQLSSIDEGLATLTGADAPEDVVTEGDRLEEVERQFVQIGNDTEGVVEEHLQVAPDHIDAFRREYAPEWDGEPAGRE